MATISVLGVVGTMGATALILAGAAATRAAGEAEAGLRAADLGRSLRRDAAAATAATADGGSLTIGKGPNAVRYAADVAGVSRSVEGRPAERFDLPGAPVFAANGRTIEVTFAAAAGSAAARPTTPWRFVATLRAGREE